MKNLAILILLFTVTFHCFGQHSPAYTDNPVLQKGMKFQGEFVIPTVYALNDVVSESGVFYISLISLNSRNDPASSPSVWKSMGSAASGNLFTSATGSSTIQTLINGSSGTNLFVVAPPSYQGGDFPEPWNFFSGWNKMKYNTHLYDNRMVAIPGDLTPASSASHYYHSSSDNHFVADFDGIAHGLSSQSILRPDSTGKLYNAPSGYPAGHGNFQTTYLAARPGSYNYGRENTDVANWHRCYFYGTSLADCEETDAELSGRGDRERRYDYIKYDAVAGGNGDDEYLKGYGIKLDETDQLWDALIASTTDPQHIALGTVFTGQIHPSAGHPMVIYSNADSTSAALLTTTVAALGSTFSSYGTIVVNATVAVSTAWGTFPSGLIVPDNLDYPQSFTATVSQTGGAGAIHTGWLCTASLDRVDRIYITSVSGSTITGNSSNSYTADKSPVWMQGGECDGRNSAGTYIGGTVYAKPAWAVLSSIMGASAQVTQVIGSIDAHTLVYDTPKGNFFTYLSEVTGNQDIFPEVFPVSFTRSSGTVTMTISSGYPSNWCERTGVVITAATDASFNGTFTPTCQATGGINNSYTWTQGGADSSATGTATSNQGKNSITLYAGSMISTPTDQTGGTTSFNFAELHPNDAPWTVGQMTETEKLIHMPARMSLNEQYCVSSGCNGESMQIRGPGARGGYWHHTYLNSNPLNMYQPHGGRFQAPAFTQIGGAYYTYFDLTFAEGYVGGSLPGAILFNVGCPYHPVGGSATAFTNDCGYANDIIYLGKFQTHAYGQRSIWVNQYDASLNTNLDTFKVHNLTGDGNLSFGNFTSNATYGGNILNIHYINGSIYAPIVLNSPDLGTQANGPFSAPTVTVGNGFTGTKTAGACSFTITAGIITGVTGC